MKRAYVLSLALLIAFAFVFECSKDAQSDNGGFVPLFNGENLDGWVNVNCGPETFTVSDGMIICTGIPTGVLRTDRQYENYILELEWRHMQEGGNAGLFVHSWDITAPGQPFTRSVEVQIMDGNAGDIFAIHGATMTPDKPHPRWPGAMRSLPTENRMNPAGQWNKYRVECIDGNITLSVNGGVVTRGFNCNPRKGYICLESEGSEIHFRNIRIRELSGTNPPPEVVAQTDRGFRSLYNGLDFRGWKQVPGNEGHWVADNWRITYDGKSEAPDQDGKSLTTEESFRNFTLIVDYRQPMEPEEDNVPIVLPDGSYLLDESGEQVTATVMDAGDSGIYLRGFSKAQINIWNWPVGSGEIWGYRLDEDLPAEINRAATPIQCADKAPGEWNRFEITLVGDVVNVKLNGELVIRDCRLPGIPEEGPVVLQHHGDPMEFANIYIKELP